MHTPFKLKQLRLLSTCCYHFSRHHLDEVLMSSSSLLSDGWQGIHRRVMLALMQAIVLQASVMTSPNQPLQRVLDLSHNNFTGGVPVFLAKDAVPPSLKISLVVRRSLKLK